MRMGSGLIIIAFLLTVFYCPSMVSADEQGDWDSQLSITADAAILVDAKTGQVLYAKNPFKKRPPASTTKVLTALLAIESGKLKEMVTVSRKAALTEGSSMYLSAGEVLSMTDLLFGALLSSGNDACAAIAEHIGGSVEKFVVLMNVKALALGALNTHFVNPHGLPDKDHYTCAYDLALIARYALANRTFTEIVCTKDKIIDWPGQEWDRKLHNTNRLLWRYLWADGVKTGTTVAAGPCLVSSASKDNRQLIAVVLHSGNRWADSIRMFEYGFNRFEHSQVAVAGAEFGRYKVQNGAQDDLPVAYAGDLGLLVPVQDPGALEKRVLIETYPAAPVKKGQVIGTISYFVHKRFAGQVNLVAAVDIEQQGFWSRLIKLLEMKFANILGQIPT